MLIADCPHCYTTAEVDIISAYNDTLTCFTPYYSSYLYRFEEGKAIRPEPGTDIKQVLIPETQVEYVLEYFHSDDIGYIVSSKAIKNISFSKDDGYKVIFKNYIPYFSGACGFNTITQEDYEYIQLNNVVSKFIEFDSCSDNYFYNFDSNVSRLEFALITQSYFLKESFEQGPYCFLEGDPHDKKTINSSSYEHEVYDNGTFAGYLDSLLVQKWKRRRLINSLEPQYAKLIDDLRFHNEGLIKEMIKMRNNLKAELKEEKHSHLQDSINMKYRKSFKALISKWNRMWGKKVKQNKTELDKFHYILIYYGWD